MHLCSSHSHPCVRTNAQCVLEPTAEFIETRRRGLGSPQHTTKRRQAFGCLKGVLGARAGDDHPKAPTSSSSVVAFRKAQAVLSSVWDRGVAVASCIASCLSRIGSSVRVWLAKRRFAVRKAVANGFLSVHDRLHDWLHVRRLAAARTRLHVQLRHARDVRGGPRRVRVREERAKGDSRAPSVRFTAGSHHSKAHLRRIENRRFARRCGRSRSPCKSDGKSVHAWFEKHVLVPLRDRLVLPICAAVNKAWRIASRVSLVVLETCVARFSATMAMAARRVALRPSPASTLTLIHSYCCTLDPPPPRHPPSTPLSIHYVCIVEHRSAAHLSRTI